MFCVIFAGLGKYVGLAQDVEKFTAKNAVYVEAFGTGGVYTLNVDRILLESRKNKYGLRAGLGVYGDDFDVRKTFVGVYTLTGIKKHHAEIGLGGTWGNRRNPVKTESPEESRVHFVPTIGYRYQKPTGGLFLRASFVAFVSISGESPKRVFPWGGLSIGLSF